MKTLHPLLAFTLLLVAAAPVPDDARYAKQREAMVASQIAVRGVTDPATLRAMGAVKRHLFVPEGSRSDATTGLSRSVTARPSPSPSSWPS